MTSWFLRPVGGAGMLARVGDLVLLLDATAGDAQDTFLTLLTEVATAGGDGRRLVRRVAGELSNWDEPPGVAVFGPAPAGVAVLVSGAAEVAVSGPDGDVRLSGADAVTWVDRVLAAPTQVVAWLGSTEPDVAGATGGRFRLDGGVVPAGGCVATPGGTAAPVPVADVPAESPHATDGVAAGAVVGGAVVGGAAGAGAAFAPEAEPHHEAPRHEMPRDGASHHEAPGSGQEPAAFAPEFEPEAPPVYDAPGQEQGFQEQGFQEPGFQEQGFQEQGFQEQGQFPPNEYPPAEFSTPGAPTAEPGPFPPPTDQPAEPDAMSPFPPAPPMAPPVGPPTGGQEVGADAGTGEVQQLPPDVPPESMPPAPPGPPGPPGPPSQPDGEPGRTAPSVSVDRSAPFVSVLLENPDEEDDVQTEAVEAADDSAAPLPTASGDVPVPDPGGKPSLGVLVLDDGATFTLDANYLVGRDPDRHDVVAGGQARPIRLYDPEGLVSRAHVLIELEGWEVRISDLDSSNGTYVFTPGATEWVRLRPHERVMIGPGTRIGLGRRGFLYESHRTA